MLWIILLQMFAVSLVLVGIKLLKALQTDTHHYWRWKNCVAKSNAFILGK